MFSVRARSVLLVSLVGAVAAFAVALLSGTSSRADDGAGAASATVPVFQAPPSGTGDVASLRTENSRTYRRADGSYTAEISARPVNFRGAAGAWEPIDTDLKPVAGGGLETTAAATVVALPGSLADAAKVSSGERSVSFALQGADAVAPTAAGDTATYADALDGVDAAYQALATGVKETLTLADTTAPSTYRFSLQASSGLTPVLQADGSVVFRDTDGTQRFVLPAPTVQAAGDPAATTDHVAYHLSEDGQSLSVVVDPAWLAAASFPIRIDPSVTSGSDVYCTLASGSSATTSDCGAETQMVGHSGSHTYRTIAHFDGLNGDVPQTASITDAHLDMWFDSQTSGSAVSQIDAVGLSRSFTSAATWNTYDATHNWTTAGGDLLADTAGGLQANDTTMRPEFADGWVTWDVSGLAERWVRDASTNHGLMVKAHNESLSNVLTVDTQLLAIDYEWHPGVESDQSYETVGIDDRSTIKVNRASGNIAAASTDVHLPGADGLDLDVGRTFNGQDLGDPLGGFGSAWANSINGAAFVNDRLWYDDARTIYANGGAIYRFDRDYAHDTATTNAFVSPSNLDADLTDDTDTGIATLTFRDTGTVWTYADSFDGETFTLSQVSDGHGHHIDLTPDPDDPTKIAEITDTNDHTLDFSYGTSGELTRITDNAGSHWDYTTDTSSGHNILTAFTDPDDDTTTYTYADDIPGVWDKLGTITDPDGHATDLDYGPDGDYSQITKITQHVDATPAHDKVWSFDYTPDSGVGDTCTDLAAIGRTVETNADDETTTYCYNNIGQVVQTLGTPSVEAPTNTTAPAITGTARDGQTLTADDGTWTGTEPLTYTRQWQRCNTAGTTCTDITGATASTYTLTAADVGFKLKVTVTATNAVGANTATSTATATIAAAPPANTAAPTITGTATDGETLTATHGTWSGTPPLTYSYQWRRCDAAGTTCTDITGATNTSYTLVAADVGSTIRVVVTATNVAGPASATSAKTTTVAAAGPANTALPTITGTTTDGHTLTATAGTWTGTAPITYTYQWQRCNASGAACADITGATAATRTLTSADAGSTNRVVVTANNAAGSASATSAATATVTGAAPANTVLPSISGTATDGQTLTANDGTWSGTAPITYTRQWRRCDADGSNCTDIAGATDDSYTLTAADVGSTIRLTITAANSADSVTATSSATGTVSAAAPHNTTAPSLTGDVAVGETLTASHGVWSGAAPITYDYQWERCDRYGDCEDIDGATATTYVPTADDIDQRLRARITASNADGTATATSTATEPLAGVAETQAPTVALAGSLVDHHNEHLDNGSYTLDISATAALDSDGIDSIDVELDDAAADASTTTCQTAGCSADGQLSITGDRLSDGIHNVVVHAFSAEGAEATKRLEFLVDHAVPDSPRGLGFTTELGSVTLRWNDEPSTDHAGWVVYRWVAGQAAPVRLTVEPIDSPEFEDDAPTTGIEVTYLVREVDRAGNLGTAATVTVTGAETPLAAPDSLRAASSSSGVTLAWEPYQHSRGYRVYRRQEGDWQPISDEIEGQPYEDANVQDGTTYEYAVRAIMPSGQMTALSAPVTAIATDTPDDPPTQVEIALDDDAVLASSSTGVSVYIRGRAADSARAFVDDQLVDDWELSCSDVCDEEHDVVIDGADLGVGQHTLRVEVSRGADTVAIDDVDYRAIGEEASAPTEVKASVDDGGHVTLAWEPSADPSVDNYVIARAGTDSATVGTNEYEDPSALGAGEQRTYAITAQSPCCASAEPATMTVAETDRLTAPAGLTLEQAGEAVNIAWDALGTADAYEILRSSSAEGPWEQVTPSPVTETNYLDLSVDFGDTYFYAVRAIKGAIISPLSEPQQLQVAVPTGPVPEISLSGPVVDEQGQTFDGSPRILTIDAGEAGGRVTAIDLDLDDTRVAHYDQECSSPCDMSHDWELDPRDYEDGTHELAVTATDAAGREASQQLTLSFDSHAPRQLDAPGAVQNASDVVLQWNPSPDADLASYELQRATGGTAFATMQTIPAGTFQATDSNVSVGETYRYRVIAKDQAGNSSEPSDDVTIAFGGAAAAPPVDFTVTPHPYRVMLQWDAPAATDIAGYHVYRRWHHDEDFKSITNGLVTPTSFVDSEAAAEDTPEYAVRTVNNDGYESPATPAIAVTVPHLTAHPMPRRLGLGNTIGDDTPGAAWQQLPGCADVMVETVPCGHELVMTNEGPALFPGGVGVTSWIDSADLGTGEVQPECDGQVYVNNDPSDSSVVNLAQSHPGLEFCGPSRANDWAPIPDRQVRVEVDPTSVAIGPDGQIAIASNGTVRSEIDVMKGAELLALRRTIDAYWAEADGIKLVRYTGDGTLYFTRDPAPTVIDEPGGPCELWRLPAGGGEPEQVDLPSPDDDDPCGIVVSPDGAGYVVQADDRIRYRTFDGTVDRALNTGSSGALLGVNRDRFVPYWLTISPDGERVLYEGYDADGKNPGLYSAGIDGGQPRLITADYGFDGPPSYATGESSLAVTLDAMSEQPTTDTESVTFSGQIDAGSTGIDAAQLLVGGDAYDLSVSPDGAFEQSVDVGELPEGHLRATLLATSTSGVERAASTSVIVDRTAPLAPTGVSAQTNDGPASLARGAAAAEADEAITHVAWNQLHDASLADGSDGSGVASIDYRYRRTDGSWSDWASGTPTGFDVPSSELGNRIQTKVTDHAGNSRTAYAAVSGDFVNCTPTIDDASVDVETPSFDALRSFTPTQKVIAGDFTFVCSGKFDHVDTTIKWAYGTGGDTYKSPVEMEPIKYTIDYDHPTAGGHHFPGLPDARQYEFSRTMPCPRGADDNGKPYENWIIGVNLTYYRHGARPVKRYVEVDRTWPTHFACSTEAERRTWRVQAFRQLGNYSPVTDTTTYYAQPSRALRIQLAHEGPDSDTIPMPVLNGWAAHHIVPINDFSDIDPDVTNEIVIDPDPTDWLRDALFSCRIHPNSPVNGVYLRHTALTRYVRGTRRYNQHWLDLEEYDKRHGTTYAGSTHHYDTMESQGADEYPDRLMDAIGRKNLPSQGRCTATQRDLLVGRLRTARATMRAGTLGTERHEN